MSKRIFWWIGALVFWAVVILINSNSAQGVFLARVQWSALLALTILPVLTHSSGRELLIGGYALNHRLAGFMSVCSWYWIATSIVDTAYIIQEYGQERLREALGHLFVPSWGGMLLVLVMIGINAGMAFAATDFKLRGQMVYGLISGFLVGVGAWLFLDFVVARAREQILPSPPTGGSLPHSRLSRPLPAVSLSDGKPLAAGQSKAAAVDNGLMNLHLADGGYCDNSGLAALAQWLHNGLSDLADRNPTRLPKQSLIIRINGFLAV